MTRNIVIGMIIGLVVGVVLGVTTLSPKLKTHSAAKSIVSKRDLEKKVPELIEALPSLQTGDAIHWRSAPPYPSDRPNVTTQARSFAKRLAILSGDKMILPVLPAKEVIAPDKLFSAIASGRIDALMTTADIAIDKEPALALFSAIPFGPHPEDTLSWLQAGKGEERLQSIFSKHNVQALVCGYLAPESAGWFVESFKTADNIKDLRIRVKGLGAKVWKKAGAKIEDLSAEEIIAALDQNQLDGAVFSTPSVDAKSGFSKFAQHYYYPGWQNQGQPLILLINTRAWKRLDQERQSLLQASCDQQTTRSMATSAHEQFQGLKELTKQGVNLQRMPTYLLSPLYQAWKDVLSEEARHSKDFRETWEDLNAYIRTRKTWQEMGYLQNFQNNYLD